ncbi:hypothetical protein [Salinirarus marinus]|uniref:hypothetical protein n=1 Tax=Salinirarus marinus TaxID=3068310 RepID=UPI003C6BE8F4
MARRRRLRATLSSLAVATAFAGTAAAHSGSLRGATQESLAVPTWLFLLTGGGAVGASFLLASFVTDRRFVEQLHAWHRSLPTPGRFVTRAARLAAVGVLLSTVAFGFVAPDEQLRNLAILVVWVAWWGGFVASTYLLGNAWPALNPVRALADALPSLDRPYPERLGAWPSVAALLALVWIEVVSPLADDPRLLATVVLVYTLVTVGGAVVVGAERWFTSVDPLSRAFRYYGHVAPIQRTDDGLRLRLPGAALPETAVSGRDEVAFVVALLFVTTYDGFVATGLWATIARTVAGVGVPPTLIYLGAYLGGFVLFLGAFRWAARDARRRAESYLTPEYLARRFAPSLLAIAAGYHLAHNLGSVLLLSPTLVAVATSPLSPPLNPPQLAGLPGWFGGLELAFVLVGHLLAVWVAHATAYDAFPGRLQAVRSQYAVTLVMVLYTMTSLWIVSEPYVPPPFIAT